MTKSISGDLLVDQAAFFAHLLKIAIIWSNGHEDGICALPTILTKLIDKDIPLLRQVIAIEH